MLPNRSWGIYGSLLALVVALVATPNARASDIGFVEDFALAADRTAALKSLIPGTEDYYYYHCLHLLNSGQFDKIEALTRTWHDRHKQTPRLTEIQTRLALLTYDKDPAKSLQFIRDRLGLRFDHQKETVGAIAMLPSILDQNLFAHATLKASSLARWRNLDNFEDRALQSIAADNLSRESRRQLLSRLQRPDLPNLVKLVAADLTPANEAPAFGSYEIHKQMTLVQLEELVKLKPDLLNQVGFVQIYCAKLWPGADDDWKRDRKLAAAYLDRLGAFVDRLSPVFNSLKAHVLFHRLVFDRAEGIYNRERFLAYLALPRAQPYMALAFLSRPDSHRYPADLNAQHTPMTMLPVVGNDEPVVRSYLEHFLVAAEGTKEFEPFINDVYLRHLFAETKIVHGIGDPDRWTALLPPELLKQIKERVDIEFAFTNKTDHAIGEPVRIEVDIKNVSTLLVKVYEINTRHFYQTNLKEIDTDINLDGLVPNAERVIVGNADPFKRSTITLDFPDLPNKLGVPELGRAGVYIIDLIGGGKNSRALIRKGQLHLIASVGTAGHVVRVIDENRKLVADAKVWLGGVEYPANKDGYAIVPFSTAPGRRPVMLCRGDFACLDHLEHQAETIQLQAGIHVDREKLIAQRVAPLMIRPNLTINGKPVSLKLLEEVRMRITSTDFDGIPSSVEVGDVQLFEDRESIHEFRVPPRLATLNVVLSAKVKQLSTGVKIDVAASQTFSINEIAKSQKIEDLHLARFGSDYVLEVLGRTGEVRPDRSISVSLKHQDFKEMVNVMLKSDSAGRVHLGPLHDIVILSVTGPEGTARSWNLLTERNTYQQVVHAKQGATITLPYLGKAVKPSREELALFEISGPTVRADKFEVIAIQRGAIELSNLAAGDYELDIKPTGERIAIRIASGAVVAGNVVNGLRHLQLPALKPVRIEEIASDRESLTVKLGDWSKFSRVHIFASRYQPGFSAFSDLGGVNRDPLDGNLPAYTESVYLSGRNIGDEYRYVLERRTMKKYPGNMLERPSLLLNPWAIRSTETGEQQARAGEQFKRKGTGTDSQIMLRGGPGGSGADQSRGGMAVLGDGADLDFLYDSSVTMLNLLPDEKGEIKVARKDLRTHSLIQVVAIDPFNTTTRTISLPEEKALFADLRLRKGLDPTMHFTQQHEVTIAVPGQPFVVEDMAGSRYETYDSLAKLYRLYSTLSKSPQLAEFSFITTWPKLKPEQKREFYSKYACHELNFFLAKRDPEFFATAVKPFLANKKAKTFLDDYLLGSDLAKYLKPWEFGRLNVPERILLARRVPGELPKTARHLTDMNQLLPPATLLNAFHRSAALEGDALSAAKGKLGESKQAFMLDGLNKAEEAVPLVNEPKTPSPATSVPAMPPAPRGNVTAVPFREGGLIIRDGKAVKPESLSRDGTLDRAKQEKDQKAMYDDPIGLALDFAPNDRERGEVRALFRKLDPTMEWAENNYFRIPIQQLAELVSVSDFWADYAKHQGETGFLTQHIAMPTRNFTEMMFALAVLDLPFESGKHDVKYEAGKMTLVPKSQSVIFHEQVRPAKATKNPLPILVSQNFYRPEDRYREENGIRYDKFVRDEFIVHTAYGCQVVVTNPTSSPLRLSTLVQMPVGSIPLSGGKYTRSIDFDLQPYHTHTLDYAFYFPLPGKFAHFPVQVARDEQFVIAAAPATFEVLGKPSKIDTESWDYVSQNGTGEQVLGFLKRENVRMLNLDKIAFRMKDRPFYEATIQLLQDRHLYQPTLYSYGLFHADAPAARQFLLHQDAFVNDCGGPLESPLLAIDPVARHQYEHLEYTPLVNARAHALGQHRQIVNDRFLEQYHRFLHTLCYFNSLRDDDLLAVAYYLLLQDRIEESLEMFNRVDRERISTRTQYDYCAAYLALFQSNPQKARSIAAGYQHHPVDRWRNTFAAVIAQVDEIEGRGARAIDPENRDQAQGQLAATEPGFELGVDAAGVHLTWQNLETVRINYYLMDVELLFSSNPFVQRSAGQFASIRPNATAEVGLPRGRTKHTVTMPAEFEGKNVLVEVVGGGKSRSVAHFATTMSAAITENFGQIRVTETAGGKALGKVYVKVYAKLGNGAVKFHKDGYTDLRGRFDYVSVNTPERQPIEKFSILILSDDRGAIIREVAPPMK